MRAARVSSDGLASSSSSSSSAFPVNPILHRRLLRHSHSSCRRCSCCRRCCHAPCAGSHYPRLVCRRWRVCVRVGNAQHSRLQRRVPFPSSHCVLSALVPPAHHSPLAACGGDFAVASPWFLHSTPLHFTTLHVVSRACCIAVDRQPPAAGILVRRDRRLHRVAHDLTLHVCSSLLSGTPPPPPFHFHPPHSRMLRRLRFTRAACCTAGGAQGCKRHCRLRCAPTCSCCKRGRRAGGSRVLS